MNGESPVYTLSRRSFGKTLALSANRLGQVGTRVVGRDGRGQRMSTAAGDLWIVRDDGVRHEGFRRRRRRGAGPVRRPTIRTPAALGEGQLHRRLLPAVGLQSDLRKPAPDAVRHPDGASADLGPRTNSRPMTLWGSYLVYVDASNRILRRTCPAVPSCR